MAKPVEKIKVALLQLNVGANKESNVKHALEIIQQVVSDYHCRVVVLPECFTGPYGTEYFANYAEPVPNGPACQQLSKIAKDLNIYLIAGSLIEKDEQNKLYNTCTIWGPKGDLIGKHRKIHLFDINMDNLKFQESFALTPGSDYTLVNIDGRKFGIGICHDIRFAELAQVYRREGAEVILYPSAFDVTQGPLYWELLQKSRASDNQLYVASISTARDLTANYVAYGHTMIVDPWGEVVCEASEKEEVLVAELDFSVVESVRRQIPIYNQRRTDIYDVVRKK